MALFITEELLKELYKNEKFKSYRLKKNERLTPGGRQYLLDKKILIDIENENSKNIIEKIDSIVTEKKNIGIFYKIKAIESLILSRASESFEKNIDLTQNLLEIARNFRNLGKAISEDNEIEKIENNLCKFGVKQKCFIISDVHIHHKNGKEIFNIYSLLWEVNFLKNLFSQEYNGEFLQSFIDYINTLEKMLAILICEIAGGKKCQVME